ncbi:hypothetical protein CMUS01_06107 [Colletotrichum musicola]|uniref:Uncharacterized protein n=1 Tax=Colletotrichum musicola TaxID=2175873 RepID=A0A8H6KPE5_9PEZI|nr:hypothetical protein CMUS01_06107 [Colletotrichum musicola]
MPALEALGATASVFHLAELCAKCSRKTAQIIRSYRDAPKEIKQLAMKAEMLKFCLKQIHQVAGDLSKIAMDELLPEIHRELLAEQLQLHYEFLLGIPGVSAGHNAHTKASRLQWALVEKNKTNRIMDDTASIQQTLDQILNVVSVLVSFIHCHPSLVSVRSTPQEFMR